MTYQDYALARQLLLETHIGTRIRESQAVEDAKFKQATKHIPRG